MILGDPIEKEDAQAGQEAVQGKTTLQFLYVPANTEKGEILVKSFDGDEEMNPKAVTPATSTIFQRVVVATEDQGSTAGFQWCVVEGDCEALVSGSANVAKDDFLEVVNGADNLIKDASTRSEKSVAIAREAYTTSADALKKVSLLGERSVISAT